MTSMWSVEYTDQFENWWNQLEADEQTKITERIILLERRGPQLGRPYVDQISTSRHQNMKEIRQSNTRILFAFDPTSSAILLIGGDKTGKWNKWYKKFIPIADDLFDQHLAELRREGRN